MPHSGIYLVSKETTPTPQPHVTFDKEHSKCSCSGWSLCVLAGVLAACFLVGVFVFGQDKLFPTRLNPYKGLVPIRKQGNLQVFPFLTGFSSGVETVYSTILPPDNLLETTEPLSELLKSYPRNHSASQRNCWLENPSADTPCFFDSSWIGDLCPPGHGYGYREADNGTFSPCFLLRFNGTEDWKPLPGTVDSVPSSLSEDFDHGFMPVHCYAKGENHTSLSVTVYPSKGFSLLFFPVSRFDPQAYLAPLVAVKVHHIPRNQSATVECSVITPNAFMLWDNGKAKVKFTPMNEWPMTSSRHSRTHSTTTTTDSSDTTYPYPNSTV